MLTELDLFGESLTIPENPSDNVEKELRNKIGNWKDHGELTLLQFCEFMKFTETRDPSYIDENGRFKSKLIDFSKEIMDRYEKYRNEKNMNESTEGFQESFSDDSLESQEIFVNAYNVRRENIEDEANSQVYNPKRNPERAIDILIKSPSNEVQIFLETETKTWKSIVNNKTSLSPDQMENFFKSNFYKKLFEKVKKNWPLSDSFYSELYNAIVHKSFDPSPCTCEEEVINEDGEFNKINIDKERAREKNAAGTQKRTNSGRKIVTFSDFGVEKKDQTLYYCWPKKDSEFKWSQWNIADKVKDENKSNPTFLKINFFHASYAYGLNLSLRQEIDSNRGYFCWNNTLQPPVQWLTPIETDQVLHLSIVQKFLKKCKERIEEYLNIPTDEIYDKINNPEKITKEQIEETKKLIRRNLDLVRNPRADNYIYD